MIRLRALDPADADAILAGQDEALAQEITGRRWDPDALREFLSRCSRWREDGPIREYAALVGHDGPLIGGGGLNRVAPGLEPGQAAMTYWILAPHRGQGHGRSLAAALGDAARADARIDRLVLRIAPHNAPSRAIARGLGALSTGQEERHPSEASRTVERWVLDLR
ncbi:GNAT family N-acetyltransferase [Brachybacterium sp. FME24]|uniref:GNAT family N-acetyltransferase n=1 Tax=Brachybacterium sp. FME24 TaxID=2742605 RepID=UPI0018675986|nr:GNAT family N-acetyltransferase [Brachybacterium sp. FME24]